MQDLSKIARPYAIAAFKQAQEEGRVPEWSDMLELLVLVIRDPTMAGLVANPNVRRAELADLIIDVCDERLSETGRNFVRVLAEFGRLAALRSIADQYREERAKIEKRTDVEVVSAFELSEAERNDLIVAMTKRLGNRVDVTVTIDESLIGGAIIRAGDMVIDGSTRGRRAELARTIA
jgi:F-type H+-transporting ATPase subunit delta